MVVDLVHRHDARRVHDGGVEARLAALVQEHAVEHVADRRLQPEADVRQAEDGRRAGQLGLRAADRLDGLDAVAAEVFRPRAEREREHVEDQVGGLDAVALDGEVVDAPADLRASSRRCGPGPPRRWRGRSPRRRTRPPATSRGRSACPASSPSSRLAELRMALPPECWSPASSTCGSVESNTRGSAAWVAKRLAISCMSTAPSRPDVVDAHVEHVRAFLHLVARHLHARVPVGLEHRVAELLASRWRWCARRRRGTRAPGGT